MTPAINTSRLGGVNVPQPKTYTGSTWAPRLFKIAASLTFACGAVLHSARIILGIESFLHHIFTPSVDIAFAVLILTAAIPGLMSWRRYSGGRVGRAGYGFAMFMLLVSVPIHFRTLMTWNTDYLLISPVWYSAIEIPMFCGLSYMVTQLKFDAHSVSMQ